MRDRTNIDEWIARASAHTGMPMARRFETAGEWRSHIDQLIRDNREAGMPDEQAVPAALEAFGQPEDLRRQLRYAQRVLDRRAALAEIRKSVPLFLLLPVVMVAFLSLTVRPTSIWTAAIGGLRFVVSAGVVMVAATYFGSLLTARITRTRPHAEFAFVPRWTYWAAVSLGMATILVSLPLLMIAALYPIIADLPHFRLGLMSFWQAFGTAMLEDSGGIKMYLAPVMLVVIALALTLYERSRCIDPANEPTIHSAD